MNVECRWMRVVSGYFLHYYVCCFLLFEWVIVSERKAKRFDWVLALINSKQSAKLARSPQTRFVKRNILRCVCASRPTVVEVCGSLQPQPNMHIIRGGIFIFTRLYHTTILYMYIYMHLLREVRVAMLHMQFCGAENIFGCDRHLYLVQSMFARRNNICNYGYVYVFGKVNELQFSIKFSMVSQKTQLFNIKTNPRPLVRHSCIESVILI